MSKRLDVLTAVKELARRAAPHSVVRGMTAEEAKPTTVDALGMVIVRSGDPGDPEIDLSPPTYWWEHRIPIELAGYGAGTKSSQQVLDDMLMGFDREIRADPTLGGLCNYLDADAPSDGEVEVRGAGAVGWADFAIIAFYSTSSALG